MAHGAEHGGGHDHGGGGHAAEHGGHGPEKKEGFLKMLVARLRNIVDLPGLIKFAAERAKIFYETVKGGMTLAGEIMRRAVSGKGAGGGGGGNGGHAAAHGHGH